MIPLIGLTGGMGSGKTTVAKIFQEDFHIPVYNSDERAKWLMENDKALVQNIQSAFGEKIYMDGKLQKEQLAAEVFNRPEKLEQLNGMVHPVVKEDGIRWLKAQISPYALKEAAILFESGAYKLCDAVVTVEANLETRIARIKERNQWTEEQIKARLAHQWTDEQRRAHSNFIINNDKDLQFLRKEVAKVHEKILKFKKT